MIQRLDLWETPGRVGASNNYPRMNPSRTRKPAEVQPTTLNTDKLSHRVADLVTIGKLGNIPRNKVLALIQEAANEAFHDVDHGNFQGYTTDSFSEASSYPTNLSDLAELIQAQVAELAAEGRRIGMSRDKIIQVIVGATLEGSEVELTGEDDL